MLRFMGIRDKIKKIRKCEIFKIAGNEKTGVVNSLVLLGSIGALLAVVEHEVEAVTCDANSEISDTDLEPVGPVIDASRWKNHCWNWSWCWSWGWGWDNSSSSE
ncbi:MAG: hypothetical protein ABIG84_05415 [archaeon]